MRSMISMMLVFAALMLVFNMPSGAMTNGSEDMITGDWELVINNQGNTTKLALTLTLEGSNVTGEFKSSTPLGNGPVSGTFADNKVTLAVTTSHATLNMTGVMKSGKLVGDWDTGHMAGKWEATRKKSK